MPEGPLKQLMLLYARRGLADWKRAPAALKRRARECLGNKIADNEGEVGVTLATNFKVTNGDRLRFIPMPQHPPNRRFEYCFFLPIQQDVSGNNRVTFELFLLVENKTGLAFRFEPAHPAGETHDYAHVQMSKQLLGKTIEAKTPSWIPDSYPAFPTRAPDPLSTFLYIATSVHGYSGGVLTVLQEIFQGDSRARGAAYFIDELKKMLT